MEDLGVMVVGLRKSTDEDEREKGVQLLVRVTCKRDAFSEEQCAKAKRWELELQGTRLRQATRQVGGSCVWGGMCVCVGGVFRLLDRGGVFI